MLRLLAVLVALCWAACVFFRSVPAGRPLGGRDTRPPLTCSAAPAAPRGYEYRRVNRLGGRLLAVQVRVIVA